MKKTVEERFWDKVAIIPEHSCWEWVASKNTSGYGMLKVKGSIVLAHRFSYLLNIGSIPKDLFVLHHCDNPGCVRIEHLYLGTKQNNSDDCVLRGRHRNGFSERTHCPHGHEYSEENTYIANGGHRSCRQCNKIRSKKFRKTKIGKEYDKLRSRERRKSKAYVDYQVEYRKNKRIMNVAANNSDL